MAVASGQGLQTALQLGSKARVGRALPVLLGYISGSLLRPAVRIHERRSIRASSPLPTRGARRLAAAVPALA